MNSTRLLLFAVAGLTTLAATIGAQGADTIVKKDGSRLRGVEVTQTSLAGVSYRKGADEAQVAYQEVGSVLWADAPETYALAKAAENKNDHAVAANLYAEAGAAATRAPLKQEATFLAGRALVSAANSDATKAEGAAAALQKYLDEAPQGFHSPHAKLMLGSALRLQGKMADAEATLKALEEAAAGGTFGRDFEARVKIEQGRGLLAQNKASDARLAYQTAGSIAGSAAADHPDPALRDIRIEAVIGEGESYIAEGQTDQALQFFRKHAAMAEPELAAAGQAGEGEALYLQGVKTKDAKILREAQLALAKARVADPTASLTSAKALYYLGKVVEALGSDKEKEAKSVAQAYHETLVRYYGASPWAAKARADAK